MSKTDQAYETLKRDILSGALRPDEPLTVATLTTRYGFGWTPLRDSLSRLEGENLVSLVRNRGYRVKGASFKELRDIQHARLAIETQMLRDSIHQGDDEWQKRVLLAHRTLARAPVLAQGMPVADYESFEAAHQDFHLALVGGGDSLWLGRFLTQIYAQVRRHQRLIVLGQAALSDPRTDAALLAALRSSSGIDQHTPLMDAALDRDEARAVVLFQGHIGMLDDLDQEPH
ncbi:GntR family transcriptional regulator [Tabrizicola oligotrophica]|uniref:GntR family transcriptional regulator n=1 Tax=Tabrizicola oligotrophica TaxID=2710650 RepID=A0A6M0QX58_9RHOB|nr:GntR family transcriptional regulator [Tabrizicola oligotrophica]NEY92039.1 GntR family transcriptional regulator [Tabrizicola oligotrophica]